jgi:hypothetical protein
LPDPGAPSVVHQDGWISIAGPHQFLGVDEHYGSWFNGSLFFGGWFLGQLGSPFRNVLATQHGRDGFVPVYAISVKTARRR